MNLIFFTLSHVNRSYSMKNLSRHIVKKYHLYPLPWEKLNTKMEPSRKDIITDGLEWAVFRYDDHANTYLVKTAATKEEADEIAYHYEKMGHKQHFYVKNIKDIK